MKDENSLKERKNSFFIQRYTKMKKVALNENLPSEKKSVEIKKWKFLSEFYRQAKLIS